MTQFVAGSKWLTASSQCSIHIHRYKAALRLRGRSRNAVRRGRRKPLLLRRPRYQGQAGFPCGLKAELWFINFHHRRANISQPVIIFFSGFISTPHWIFVPEGSVYPLCRWLLISPDRIAWAPYWMESLFWFLNPGFKFRSDPHCLILFVSLLWRWSCRAEVRARAVIVEQPRKSWAIPCNIYFLFCSRWFLHLN